MDSFDLFIDAIKEKNNITTFSYQVGEIRGYLQSNSNPK